MSKKPRTRATIDLTKKERLWGAVQDELKKQPPGTTLASLLVLALNEFLRSRGHKTT